MCDKWEREWDRNDDMGIFTMDQCCDKADEVDPDHEYESDDTSDDSSDDDSSEDDSSTDDSSDDED